MTRLVLSDRRCTYGILISGCTAQLSIEIGDTLRDDNKLLDGMDNEFSQTGALLDSARNRIDGLVKSRCKASADLRTFMASPSDDWAVLPLVFAAALGHTCAI
jgi:hypothetical protein